MGAMIDTTTPNSVYIDFLEPDTDLNKALDSLGKCIGVLYAECWNKNKRHLYSDKPFDLNINAFANLWFHGDLVVFAAKEIPTQTSVGFLSGSVFRPMQYNATVFQIMECYAREAQVENALLRHAVDAMRVRKLDEIWIQAGPQTQTLPEIWKSDGTYTVQRYIRA